MKAYRMIIYDRGFDFEAEFDPAMPAVLADEIRSVLKKYGNGNKR